MSTEVKKKKTAADGSADNVVSDVELKANTAALLCYLGLWVSGIIFLVLEQKNRVVRFHAAQSIVTFGFLMLVQGLLSLIPLVGDYFSIVIGILMLVLWIVLMVTAYRGEVLRLPLAAELAERLADVTKTSNDTTPADHEPVLSSPGTEVKTSTQAAAAVVVGKTGGSGEFYQTTRTQHTISYCFAIFWSFVFLVFLNFYSQYIAVYSVQESGRWFSYPLLTASFNLWLPLINAALVFSIAGNIIMIIHDKYMVHETVQITISLMFIAAMAQLLVLFPFNFNIIPHAALAGVMSHIIRILLIIIVIALIISLLVHIVKIIVHAVKGDFD